MMNIKMLKAALAGLVLSVSGFANAGLILADTVDSFVGGSGFGVFDQSGGSYSGATGNGVFDAEAVTALDGAILALGDSSPNEIILSFSTGMFFDGAGADLRFYDSFGLSEGFILDISADGLNFFHVGTFAGDFSFCSVLSPCATDVDISGASITSASFMRISAHIPTSVGGYPAGYDLDAVEALHFSTTEVPEPSTLAIFALGIMGLASRRFKKQ